MKLYIPALCLIFMVAACNQSGAGNTTIKEEPAPFAQGKFEDMVINFSNDDEEMNAAIEKAKSSLNQFDAALASHNKNLYGFNLKQAFGVNANRYEHIWIYNITINKGEYYGILNDDPEGEIGYKFGDCLKLDKSKISDWMYLDNDTLRGGFTMRVMRNRIPADQRAQFDREVGMIIAGE